MSCKLIDFYQSLTKEEQNSPKYQEQQCYYFDPFVVLGRINAYSPNLFTIDQKDPYTKTLNLKKKIYCPYRNCVTSPKYDPDVNAVNCDNDLFYGFTSTYTITDKSYNPWFCTIPSPECTAQVSATVIITESPYCTNFAYSPADSNGFPGFQCVDGKCVLNSKFPGVPIGKDKTCPQSSNDSENCIFLSKNRTLSEEDYNVVSLYDKKKPSAGLMTMEFIQEDESQPTTSNLSKLKKWRENLVNETYPPMSPEKLPFTFSYPLYIISNVHSIVDLFYYQIYSTYTKNDFNNTSIMGPNNTFNNYLNQIVNLSKPTSNLPFKKSLTDGNLYSQKLCLLPEIIDNGNNNFQVRFYFSYKFYQQISGRGDKPNVFKSMMKSLIDDGNSATVNFVNIRTNTTMDIKEATYSNLVWDENNMYCTYFDFSDYAADSSDVGNYLVEGKTLKNFFDIMDAGQKNVFLLTIQTTIDIDTWSPMLYAYSKLKYNIPKNISKSFAEILSNDTNGLYPSYSLFSQDICGNMDYYNCFYNNCEFLFVPSSTRCSAPYDAATIFVTMSDECSCIKTNITPVNASPQYANKTSMCFTNDCSAEQLKKFGITVPYCKENCSDITNWLSNPDKSYNIQNSDQFDQERYEEQCRSFPPIVFNYYYFIFLVVSFVALSFIFAVIFKNSKSKRIFYIVFNLVGLGISTFIGFVLAGQSFCNERKNICYSNLLPTFQIPNSCCQTNVQNCECVFNSDCGDPNFYCSSGLCVPYTEADYQKTSKKIYPVYDILVFALSFLFVMVALLLCLKVCITEKVMIIVLSVGVYAISFILLQNYYWREIDITFQNK